MINILLYTCLVIVLTSCNRIDTANIPVGDGTSISDGIMGRIPNKESIVGYETESMGYQIAFDFEDINGNTAHLVWKDGSKSTEESLKEANYVLIKGNLVNGRYELTHMFTKFRGLPKEVSIGSLSDITEVNTSSLIQKTETEYYKEGVRELKFKNTRLALENFHMAIELNAKSEIYYTGRANCYIGLGEWKKAIDDCNKSISLNPNQAVALFIRGSAKKNLNQEGCQDIKKSSDLGYELAQKEYKKYCK